MRNVMQHRRLQRFADEVHGMQFESLKVPEKHSRRVKLFANQNCGRENDEIFLNVLL
jgi:hypothetical protein